MKGRGGGNGSQAIYGKPPSKHFVIRSFSVIIIVIIKSRLLGDMIFIEIQWWGRKCYLLKPKELDKEKDEEHIFIMYLVDLMWNCIEKKWKIHCFLKTSRHFYLKFCFVLSFLLYVILILIFKQKCILLL